MAAGWMPLCVVQYLHHIGFFAYRQEKDMTNLINPKPRFGWNPDTKLMYDYVAGKDVALTENYSAVDGVWDLLKVRDLIMSGATVESARVGPAVAPRAPTPGISGATPPAVAIKLLGFTPIQAAAMALTPEQLANGLSQADVAKIGMTKGRAIALKLTPAQMEFLKVPA
jgi:hypothetical protein